MTKSRLLIKNFWLVVLTAIFFVFIYSGIAQGQVNSEDERIVIQVDELKNDLGLLEKIRNKEKTTINIEKEKIIRQSALFKVIEISLLENNQMLETALQLKNLDKEILFDFKKALESDNNLYESFISQINLAESSEVLKEIAQEIKIHRQDEEGLLIRKFLGLALSLEELKAIQLAKSQMKMFDSVYSKNYSQSKKDIMFVKLEAVENKLDVAYQLAVSSYLRLQNMESFEDFVFVGDWLERAKESIDVVYQIFRSIELIP